VTGAEFFWDHIWPLIIMVVESLLLIILLIASLRQLTEKPGRQCR
jgi:hypothetical protein